MSAPNSSTVSVRWRSVQVEVDGAGRTELRLTRQRLQKSMSIACVLCTLMASTYMRGACEHMRSTHYNFAIVQDTRLPVVAMLSRRYNAYLMFLGRLMATHMISHVECEDSGFHIIRHRCIVSHLLIKVKLNALRQSRVQLQNKLH